VAADNLIKIRNEIEKKEERHQNRYV
jgi:hypothetical protein